MEPGKRQPESGGAEHGQNQRAEEEQQRIEQIHAPVIDAAVVEVRAIAEVEVDSPLRGSCGECRMMAVCVQVPMRP